MKTIKTLKYYSPYIWIFALGVFGAYIGFSIREYDVLVGFILAIGIFYFSNPKHYAPGKDGWPEDFDKSHPADYLNFPEGVRDIIYTIFVPCVWCLAFFQIIDFLKWLIKLAANIWG